MNLSIKNQVPASQPLSWRYWILIFGLFLTISGYGESAVNKGFQSDLISLTWTDAGGVDQIGHQLKKLFQGWFETVDSRKIILVLQPNSYFVQKWQQQIQSFLSFCPDTLLLFLNRKVQLLLPNFG